MTRRTGKQLSSALALYKYLWSVPDGKVITIKKTKGALFLKIEDEVKEPENKLKGSGHGWQSTELHEIYPELIP